MEDIERTRREDQFRDLTPLLEAVVGRWRTSVDNDYMEDLRQVARLAAWRAVLSYDANRGVSLSSYAWCCAHHSILDALRTFWHDHRGLLSFDDELVEGKSFEVEWEDHGARCDWSAGVLFDCLSTDAMCSAYQALSTTDQEIIARFYGGQQSDEWIGHALSHSTEAVKKRRQRAIHRMQRILCAPTGTDWYPKVRKPHRM